MTVSENSGCDCEEESQLSEQRLNMDSTLRYMVAYPLVFVAIEYQHNDIVHKFSTYEKALLMSTIEDFEGSYNKCITEPFVFFPGFPNMPFTLFTFTSPHCTSSYEDEQLLKMLDKPLIRGRSFAVRGDMVVAEAMAIADDIMEVVTMVPVHPLRVNWPKFTEASGL